MKENHTTSPFIQQNNAQDLLLENTVPGVLNGNKESSKANIKNSYFEAKLELTGATLFSVGSSAGHAELNIITTLHLQHFSVDHVWKTFKDYTLLLLRVLGAK